MSVVFADERLALHEGDCLDVLATLPPSSFDSIVTDPPYGISFMGQQWDQPGAFGSSRRDGQKAKRRGHRRVDGSYVEEGALAAGTYDHQSPEGRERFQGWCEAWGRACLAVAKPGAWLLAFGSPRSHHRLAVGLEDAGWELTDEIEWLFAQGMPKGHSRLKPAHEPIVMARKPAKRVTPLQIAETLIPFAGDEDEAESKGKNRHADFGSGAVQGYGGWTSRSHGGNCAAEGRWPANVVLTAPVLDRGTEGVVISRQAPANGHRPSRRGPSGMFSGEGGGLDGQDELVDARLSTSSYSRFFLIPKANRRERNAGIDDLEERPLLWSSGTQSPGTFQSAGTKRAARNHHPTVKPLELMEHLVRLVTPPGGAILDPFIGSGTTAIAAVATGRTCVGIDRDPAYLQIALRRLRLLRGTAVAAEVAS